MNQASGGDPLAFAKLVDPLRVRLSVFIRRTAHRVLGGDCDEEDLLQTVLAHAWRKLPSFEPQGPGSFYRWLVALARGSISDRVKYMQAKDRSRMSHLESKLDAGGKAYQPIDPATSIPGRLVRKEECEMVEKALASLDVKHREVVEKHLLEAMSLKEIAKDLGISKNAVFERLHRGMDRIRDDLGSGG